MPTRNVTLTPEQDAFIEKVVESGDYQNASEAVRAGLRLLEERQQRLRALREALIAGEKSGPARPLDVEALIARKRRKR